MWGDNWIQAKTQAECYEYLFEAAVKLHSLGFDVSQAPATTHQNGTTHIEGEESPPLVSRHSVVVISHASVKIAGHGPEQ